MKSCENCGCRVYSDACVNCDEAIYIEKQYDELDMKVPESIANLASDARKTIEHKKRIKETI